MEQSSPPFLGVSLETPRAVIRMGKSLTLESISPCEKLSWRGLGSVSFATNGANCAPARKLLQNMVWGFSFLLCFEELRLLVIVPLKLHFSWTKTTQLKVV